MTFELRRAKMLGELFAQFCFQDFQPMWSWSTNVTDRQMDKRTDRRHAIARLHFAL